MSRITRRLAAASIALVAMTAPASAQAAPQKPAWCPSWLTAGVAVEFSGNRILPGRPIADSEAYSYRNTNRRPVMINASWDRSWASTASVTVSVGGEYGFSPLASVKAQIDMSVASTVTRSSGFSQPISLPAGKRLKMWWAIDLRQVSLRYIRYGVGCRPIAGRTSAWTTVTAPRSNTLKPQHAFVS